MCSYTIHDGVFQTSYCRNAIRRPPTMLTPPPWMQKFTCDELCRIGFVRSPGFNTDNATAVPLASPLPTPVAGLRIIDTRRPLAGGGTDARRAASASIAPLGMTTGVPGWCGGSGWPVRSTNSNSTIFLPVQREPRRRPLRRLDGPSGAGPAGSIVHFDAQ